MPIPLVDTIGKIAGGILDVGKRFIADKTKLAEFENSIHTEVLSIVQTEIERASDVIIAEAKGESFLQRNWRPILMLSFTAIIVNNYILAPYLDAVFGSGIQLTIPPDMWNLLKIGVGGYIVGRSAEKGIEKWKGSQ
jgi:hypothetical protein